MNDFISDGLMRHQQAISLALLVLAVVVCGIVNGFGPKVERRSVAEAVRYVMIFHLILGPWGYFIIAYERQHPELWVDWFRNPHIAVPFIICIEVILVTVLLWLWMEERRRANGLASLKLAIRLQEEGRHEAAEVAYQRGLKLMRMKRSADCDPPFDGLPRGSAQRGGHVPGERSGGRRR
jgi:hypothetical protein